MEGIAWDITKSASSHAALAGVLASLAIALLTLLASRAKGPLTAEQSHVFKLLVLATFFLLVSAIMWGGLAGQPAIDALKCVEMGRAEILVTRNYVTGSAAVILLAIGSLSIVGGILELVDDYGARGGTEWSVFAARSFALLAALAAYEIFFFVNFVILKAASLPDNGVANWIAVALAVVVGILGWPGLHSWTLNLRRRVQVKAKSEYVGSVQIRCAVVAGAASTVAYAINPIGSFYSNDIPKGPTDVVCAFLVGVSAVAAVLFMLAAAKSLTLTPRDRAST